MGLCLAPKNAALAVSVSATSRIDIKVRREESETLHLPLNTFYINGYG